MSLEWDLERDGAFVLAPEGYRVVTVNAAAFCHEWNATAGKSLDGRQEILLVPIEHGQRACSSPLHSCIPAQEVIAVIPNAE